ncbi:hypothetical protein SAMN04487967_1953 [Natronorubrum sediminis]|uniref:Uncharacterized protein n=1 Tax=Natronorubrum sediminis TaxID=640943 RepID=A0A1H6FYT5_9EURY|nr:hypothetical protein SAMN04487967_1953 [Natronorubrum sediminis]
MDCLNYSWTSSCITMGNTPISGAAGMQGPVGYTLHQSATC